VAEALQSSVIMNPLILLVKTGNDGQIEQIARTFGVDWPHLVAQIISFAIVCLLLYRFAYRPVLKILGDRRQLIAQSLADSQKLKGELAQAEARRQEVIAQANAQAARFMEEARGVAARLQEQESLKAIAVAERIIVNARQTAAEDHDRMLADLKREVGRLVVQITAAITGKILTSDDQRRLAEETARTLNA
jgi:F-type H+-transporting ATPase subunit b